MPIKSRSYFYPVLSVLSSDYVPGVFFDVEIDASVIEGSVRDQISLNYEVSLSSISIEDFIRHNRASLVFDVYCGDTMYRELFRLSELKGEIHLPVASIKGKLEVQPLIVVTDNSLPFVLDQISPEYNSNQFDLEIGAPLAIAPSVLINVDFAVNSIKEMVKIRLEMERDKNSYAIDLTTEQIVVYMGEHAHEAWTLMSNDVTQKPTLFFSVYKDCIAAVLETLVESNTEVEYVWMDFFKEELQKKNLALPTNGASFSEVNELALKILGNRGFERLVAHAG